jgi:hypothetical protein
MRVPWGQDPLQRCGKTDPKGSATTIPAPPHREAPGPRARGRRTRAAGLAVTTALLRSAARLTPGDAVHVEHKWEIDVRPPIVDHWGWRP